MAGYVGNVPVPQATQTRDNFTATSGQTTFATSGYTPGYLDVYLNGVHLDPSDYTATNGSDVVLGTGATTGDVVTVVAYTTFTVAGAIDNTSVTTDSLTVQGSADVTGTVTADGLTVEGSSSANTLDSSISAYNTPQAQNNSKIEFWNGAYQNTGQIKLRTAFGASMYDRIKVDENGDISFYEDTGTTPKLFWDASAESLGIGTTSPNYRAHFHTANAGSSTYLHITNGDCGTATSDGFVIGVATGASPDAYVQNKENSSLIFATNNAEKMRIDSSGNVGIGTSSPDFPLEVYKTGTSEVAIGTSNGGDARLSFYESDSSTKEFFLNYDGTNNTGEIGTSGNANAIHIARDNGKVTKFSPAINTNRSSANLSAQRNNFGLFVRATGADNVTGNIIQGIALGDDTTCGMYAIDSGGGAAQNIGFYTGNNTAVNERFVVNQGGAQVVGTLSKSSGSFKIDHPLESKTDTHHLVHSFVEAPQADNIYRGKIDLVAGSATVNIDTVAGMTDGTFVALNREVQCFTSNESGWTAVRGSVSGNILTIEAQDDTCTDTVSWLVVGERHDPHMYETDMTDENGKVIVEPLKETSNVEEN